MMNIKMIPEFDGTSLTAVEWLRKAESACQLCGIEDVVRVIGLRLTGAAFDVYDQLAPEDQRTLEKVKESLLAAFAPDPYMAFKEFKVRRLREGETPDAFLAGLRRLALLAGGIPDKVLASAFIDGLPEHIQETMRAGARMETLTLDELLTRARAMLARGPSSSNGERWRNQEVSLRTISGDELRCVGSGSVVLKPPGGRPVVVEVIVSDHRPLGVDFVLGMGGIKLLGGVFLDSRGQVRFSPFDKATCAAASTGIQIDENDFVVTYNSVARSWTTAWKWANGNAPLVLQNTKEEYPPAPTAKVAYEAELKTWIQHGWLVPYDAKRLGPPKALIPLMAIVQRNKGKVRPVMDFRELNTHIAAFTADSEVCAQKLRDWRRQGANVSVLDLENAYLQVHVDEALWPYQTVVFKGQKYCLTRLGFGLNVAPLVMKTVLNCALSQNPEVKRGTSAYVDDILVNEDVIEASRVAQHLAEYGLTCKAPARVADSARVLGLKVWGENEKLFWKRDSGIDDVPKLMTRRSVFSYCGRLVGHYPVCGWLRVAAAYAKRKANDVSKSWDGPINDERLEALLRKIAAQVKVHDPAKGRWDATGDKARIWADASSLALGVVLEVGDCVMEDAAWLRPNDAAHINMAELDALIRGLNLALSWGMRRIDLMTDSVTVHRWISDALSGKARLRTKATSEMLIRRRVAIFIALIKEYDLEITISLIKSADNKADTLTRMPQQWLMTVATEPAPVCAAANEVDVNNLIARIHHASGHPGVKRTLYFTKRVNSMVTRRQVRNVVLSCETCRSIDPAPIRWKQGSLGVKETWHRLAIDVTHCSGNHISHSLIVGRRDSLFGAY
uniref:RNase H domain-containing protein n=1 Tax=Trichuris muris TaxID=70415 RepID=A0A5S6Q541_TRIMR